MEDIDYSNLTKGQRKRVKKQQKSQEKATQRAERDKAKRIKKIRNYGITLLLLLAVVAFFIWRSIPPKDAPIIEIAPSSYNFGAVSQSKGTVSTTMTINNKGSSDLIINNMDSSCGCTSAAVAYNGIEGPRFSMSTHGTNPKDWQQVIPPGDSADLIVYYNPNVHRELRGAVTRAVSIFSNDPRHRVKEVRISATQIDEQNDFGHSLFDSSGFGNKQLLR